MVRHGALVEYTGMHGALTWHPSTVQWHGTLPWNTIIVQWHGTLLQCILHKVLVMVHMTQTEAARTSLAAVIWDHASTFY